MVSERGKYSPTKLRVTDTRKILRSKNLKKANFQFITSILPLLLHLEAKVLWSERKNFANSS